MATREDYIEAAGGLEAAIKNEHAVLSIGRDLLPDFAIDRIDGNGDPRDDEKCWAWLITQLSDWA